MDILKKEEIRKMSFLDKIFKKEEEKNDILEETRNEIVKKGSHDLRILGSNAKEEALKVIEWCKVREKKIVYSDRLDVTVVLMSYPAESSLLILKEIADLMDAHDGSFESNVLAILGRIDEIYIENDHIRELKKRRAEIYYLLGKKSSYRIKRSVQLLAVLAMSSESLNKAREICKNEDYSKEVRRELDEELKKYDEKIVQEVMMIK